MINTKMRKKWSTYLDNLESYRIRLITLSRRRSIRHGLPFLLFVVGGSFGLQYWTQIRYQFSNVKGVSDEEAKKMGLEKTRKVTPEDLYEEIKDIDIDNWENKRGPRPWELEAQKQK